MFNVRWFSCGARTVIDIYLLFLRVDGLRVQLMVKSNACN